MADVHYQPKHLWGTQERGVAYVSYIGRTGSCANAACVYKDYPYGRGWRRNRAIMPGAA